MTLCFLVNFSTYFNWRFLGISEVEISTLGPVMDSTMKGGSLRIFYISSSDISSMIASHPKGMVSRLKLSFT